jgi:hypothetical protein
MLDQAHLSNEDLLLAADGDVPCGQGHRIRAHLAGCPDCRRMLAEMERVSSDFARAHRETLSPSIPSVEGPHALLRIRVAEAAQSYRSGFWRRFALLTPSLGWAGVAAIAVIGFALGTVAFHPATSGEGIAQAAAVDAGFVPDHSLTPGVTRPVSMTEVCSMPHEEVIKGVSASLRASVFREYGIKAAGANNYEVDYLIAPGLGGTDDIHNLWPEPYRAGTWDAHAKDALEERLHRLVCTRKLDLLTAQHAIAGDWISAYKKYLGTDRPQFVAKASGAPLPSKDRRKYQAG